MEARFIPAAGRSVPIIGLGAYANYHVTTDAEKATREVAMERWLDAGGRIMDTAPMYGTAADFVGDTLVEQEDIVWSSHVRAKTRAEAEGSLEAAINQHERVDICIVHNLISIEDHMPWLTKLKSQGHIGMIGASHYLPAKFETLLPGMRYREYGVVQVPYNPLERSADKQVLPEAEASQIAVAAEVRPKEDPVFRCQVDQEKLAPLSMFGVSTWPQAVIKWILSEPRITYVVLSSADPEEVAALCQMAHGPWFSGNERTLIRQLAESAK